MRAKWGVVTVMLVAATCSAQIAPAQQAGRNNATETDLAAIRQTALDYLEGWYECNAKRMERALHPNLAKRISYHDADGDAILEEMSALELVQKTRSHCNGKPTPKDQQQKSITIFDVYQDMASVKVEFTGWVDYVHMTKYKGRWVIANVLWHLKPRN